MGTTPTYGLPYPEATDFVTDGAGAIQALAEAVDSDLAGHSHGAGAEELVDAKGDLLVGSAADTLVRRAVGANGTVLTADSAESDGVKWATPATGASVLIAETVLGSSAASITLSSIPGTYRHLHLVIASRGTASANQVNLLMRLNGDTSSVYFTTLLQVSTSASPSRISSASSIQIGRIAGATATAAHAGVCVVDLPHYAEASYFQYLTANNAFSTSAANHFLEFSGGEWRSAAAVTSIELLLSSGSFDTGTVVSLYGMKGA